MSWWLVPWAAPVRMGRGGQHDDQPPPGRSGGHQRAELMTATGQFLMSLDKLARARTAANRGWLPLCSAAVVKPSGQHAKSNSQDLWIKIF